MSEIYRVIETLIKDVKRNINQDNITFVKAYNNNIANAIKEKGGKQNGKERSSRGKGCTQPF